MSKSRNRKYPKIIRNRKARIEHRLGKKLELDPFDDKPVMSASNIHYEISEKTQGISYGGIGAIHQMVRKVGLIKEIDKHVDLLKFHFPYHESDHVLNIAYNVMLGGTRLEDIELRRNDEAFLNALDAVRIPDPTTAGDFTRRFNPFSIEVLMNSINRVRSKVWKKRAKDLLKEEILLDVDGTLAGTLGECKEGMDISYKGVWGYHPLMISVANTNEVLFLVNRPGNVTSHEGCVPWIDKAIKVVKPHTKRVTVRGDTDFSLTAHFDRWAEQVDFVFGMDAMPKLVEEAESLKENDWKVLGRPPKYNIKTTPRQRPENVKEEIVKQREFTNKRLVSEDVAEFRYRPGKCNRDYRVVVVRKNISVEKGEQVLFDEVRYFFYITTREDLSAAGVVGLANGRCNQENVIEQHKNGINAMRMPVDNLVSNWAYMVMASLAWTLKAWFALMMQYKSRRNELLKMEFRGFLHAIILLPAQIVRQGRKIIYRLLGYNEWLTDFFSAWEYIRKLRLA